MKTIKVSKFINTKYKDFWRDVNKNRNVFTPEEQLMAIEKRIIWGSYKIGLNTLNRPAKTQALMGEVIKYHVAADTSISDSIKGLAAEYKRQPAVRLLKAEGNMGSFQGDPGAPARYTSVSPTPILLSIFKDLEYVELIESESGVMEPSYISSPLPMAIINGFSPIGQGYAAYYDERRAGEVIDWIEELQTNPKAKAPDPYSSAGAKTYKAKNGYTYYDAVIVKDGKNDAIVALPPKVSPQIAMENLKTKLGAKHDKNIVDGAGKNEDIKILIPRNVVKEEDWTKYKLRTARREQHYIWDNELDTMRMSSLKEIAEIWLKERKVIVEKRLKAEIETTEKFIKRIDLIQEFVEKEMSKWNVDKIQKAFGEEDSALVLSQTQRAFLPDSLAKNKIERPKYVDKIKENESNIKEIEKFILNEAREIIKEQEEFFA